MAEISFLVCFYESYHDNPRREKDSVIEFLRESGLSEEGLERLASLLTKFCEILEE